MNIDCCNQFYWSRKLTLKELLSLPEHMRPEVDPASYIDPWIYMDFIEHYPIYSWFGVNSEDCWQRSLFKLICARENILINTAETLRINAIDSLTRLREFDNRNPINIGFVVRVRQDTLGPRLDWVKFTGRSEPDFHGKKTAFTTPIKLRGTYRYSSRIFSNIPEPIRGELMDIEGSAAQIRYEVAQLTKLRQLCRESPTPP